MFNEYSTYYVRRVGKVKDSRLKISSTPTLMFTFEITVTALIIFKLDEGQFIFNLMTFNLITLLIYTHQIVNKSNLPLI